MRQTAVNPKEMLEHLRKFQNVELNKDSDFPVIRLEYLEADVLAVYIRMFANETDVVDAFGSPAGALEAADCLFEKKPLRIFRAQIGYVIDTNRQHIEKTLNRIANTLDDIETAIKRKGEV